MKTVIVGGSASGMGVAAKLRRNLPDAEISVYQNEKYVSLGACGLPYFVGDNFSDPNQMIARTIDQFKASQINIYPQSLVNQIDFTNQKITYLDGKGQTQSTNYDHLVIGVGAQPIIPPIPGIKSSNVFTLTRLEDGVNLKIYFHKNPKIKKVAVIGSGFIGLEMTEVLGSLNKEVYLVEKAERISPRTFDPEISALIEEELIKNQVQIFKNNSLVEIEQNKAGLATKIKLASKQELKVDAIILAVGFKPATDFLKNTALKLSKQGAIIVDEQGRTNLKNVWSCGDCATTPSRLTHQDTYTALATVPRKFAKIIADNIAGAHKVYAGTLQTAIVRVFGLEIARTGLNESEAQDLGYDYITTLIKDVNQTDYVPGQTALTLKLILNQKTRTLIGAQIAGTNKAVFRINALIAMIWNQTKVDADLEQIDLPYAPPFARPVDIIHLALSKLNKQLTKKKGE